MIEAMKGRIWVPADYVDRGTSTDYPTPQEWLRTLGENLWTLRSPYDGDPDESARWQFHPLADGQSIHFHIFDDLGSFDFDPKDTTFASFSKIDPRADWFALASDKDNPTRHLGDLLGKAMSQDKPVTILSGWWSPEPIEFLFRMVDGNPTLARVIRR